MNSGKLWELLNSIGLNVYEVKPNVFKGYANNIKQWHTFRMWVNKSGKVTVKTCGVQKSFHVMNARQLREVAKGFDLL
ncbi:hypothetical protein [Staphylococcus succinus]|uniref:hypothetical protein n=1 Tax=Staphylococcus succinus TaxID=61015 RepID=UPI000E67CB10|nr:hypothetical protein [Staphylococcus succinus]RIN23975.1 hypothetical protein BU067_10860 [Staphylococcus succinus]